MERMINENKIYNAALYCRLSKDDEQAGESVSIGTQKMILEKYCKEHGFHVFDGLCNPNTLSAGRMY